MYKFLWAFAKPLRERLVSCVMFVHPSVRMEQRDFRWNEYHEISYLRCL